MVLPSTMQMTIKSSTELQDAGLHGARQPNQEYKQEPMSCFFSFALFSFSIFSLAEPICGGNFGHLGPRNGYFQWALTTRWYL